MSDKLPRASFGYDAEAPLQGQIGGDHYKDMPIQVVEFCHRNGIGFVAGNIIKYTCRYRQKGGRDDLLKARHYIDMLLEMEP